MFGADEALARGLVRSLHAPDELLPAARALAREIADNTRAGLDRADAPDAVADVGRAASDGRAPDRQPLRSRRAGSRPMRARASAAFLEKRPAVFPDRVSSDLPSFFPWWDEPTFE